MLTGRENFSCQLGAHNSPYTSTWSICKLAGESRVAHEPSVDGVRADHQRVTVGAAEDGAIELMVQGQPVRSIGRGGEGAGADALRQSPVVAAIEHANFPYFAEAPRSSPPPGAILLCRVALEAAGDGAVHQPGGILAGSAPREKGETEFAALASEAPCWARAARRIVARRAAWLMRSAQKSASARSSTALSLGQHGAVLIGGVEILPKSLASEIALHPPGHAQQKILLRLEGIVVNQSVLHQPAGLGRFDAGTGRGRHGLA